MAFDNTKGQTRAPALDGHVSNIAANLQLIADMGYGAVAVAAVQGDGSLKVVADARPMTAVAALAASRVGKKLSESDESEAYEALRSGQPVQGSRRRITRGIAYTTSAYPVRVPPQAVIVRDLAQQVAEAPGQDGVGLHECRAGAH